MESLIEFLEKQTNKKINIFRYNNQKLNLSQKLMTFDDKVYVVEFKDELDINNIDGYAYVVYQNNVNFECVKGILNNLYSNINTFEHNECIILSSNYELDIDVSTPEIIESETYRSTYVSYLGHISDIEIFNYRFSIFKEIVSNLNNVGNVNKFMTINDLILYKSISTISDDKFFDYLVDTNRLKNLDDNLLQTGFIFIENNLNISKTSQVLFLHRNTLIYRLEKIKEILGLDLKNFKDSLAFYITVNAYFSHKI